MSFGHHIVFLRLWPGVGRDVGWGKDQIECLTLALSAIPCPPLWEMLCLQERSPFSFLLSHPALYDVETLSEKSRAKGTWEWFLRN